MYVKKTIPLLITALVSIIIILDLYFPIYGIPNIAKFFNNAGVIIIAVFAGGGVINISKVHYRRIQKRGSKWYLSIWLIIVMLLTMISGFLPPFTKHSTFIWFYQTIFSSVQLALLSLSGFFLGSIAFRAFRARNWEAGVMLLFAVMGMIRNSPAGVILLPWVGNIADWNISTVAMANYRALSLTGAIGVIAVAVRTLIGKERGYLGEEEGGAD